MMYGACYRNWGAAQGLVITDGCGEYMSNPSMPDHCVACGCHRSFHQQGIVVGQPPVQHYNEKVTPEQAEAMRSLAESINWDMSRQRKNNDITIACHEIGVSRVQFRAWVQYQKRKMRVFGDGEVCDGGAGPSDAASATGGFGPDEDGSTASA